MTTPSEKTSPEQLQRIAPALFVLLWSTGFIGSKFASLYAEPFTFTAIRMSLVCLILSAIAFASGAPWPSNRTQLMRLCVAGVLVHATYLCGILYALRAGVSVAMVAIIAGTQPLLTALFARFFLGERLQRWQQWGMVLGFFGVLTVVLAKYPVERLLSSSGTGLIFAAIGLLGITAGTLFQKRFCADMDLRTGGFVQYAATCLCCAGASLIFETGHIEWHPHFIGAIVWLALVLSIGAIGLLYYLIRGNAASTVSSLFFLTPATTAILAYLIFSEPMPALALVGMVLTAVGVILVVRGQK